MHKKLITLLLTGCVAGSLLTGCNIQFSVTPDNKKVEEVETEEINSDSALDYSVTETDTETKETDAITESTVEEVNTDDYSQSKDSEAETNEDTTVVNETETNTTEVETVRDGEDNSQYNFDISEQEILNEKGVIIKAVKYVEDKGLLLNIENTNDFDIKVVGEGYVFNGYRCTLNKKFSNKYVAGEKVDTYMPINYDELRRAGISNIASVGLRLKLVKGYSALFESNEIQLVMDSNVEADTELDIKGYTSLYDDASLQLFGKYVKSDELYGTALLLYVKNETKQSYEIVVESASIDDVEVESIETNTSYPNNTNIFVIKANESKFKNIEDFSKLSLSLRVENENYSTIHKDKYTLDLSLE